MSSIGVNGLILDTLQTITTNLTTSLQSIYSLTGVIDPSSPDGQWLNTIAQLAIQQSQLLQQVNAMFDPDQAIGVILDQRVAINGIQRLGGTFTIQNVSLTITQSVTLYGTDQTQQTIYTVQDNAGTQWQLQGSIVLSPGTYSLSFQAANPGAILSAPNTITQAVTIVLGVSAINNPTTYTTLGQNEESDAQLKIRRQQSVALSSQGYLQGLLAALLNIPGMNSAFVYENDSGTDDDNDVPGHSIWVITSGTSAAAAIANAIYTKRNAGCGMKGDQIYPITQADGSVFTILWDVVSQENLFIQFTATSINGTAFPNYAAILSGLVNDFTPAVAATANINELATAVQLIDPNTLVTVPGFNTTSTAITNPIVTPSAKNFQFAVSSQNIIILPIILTPGVNEGIGSVPAVPHGSTQVFTSVGGYGTYTYSLKTNNSGGSITSVGLYTSGASASVIDVVKVVDSLANTTSVSVSVT